MRQVAGRPTASVRPIGLWALAIAAMVLPDDVFSSLTTVSHELTILRILALVVVSLLAVVPWAGTAPPDVRRRLRRWSIPGVTATLIYVVSTDPSYLLLGFCLLTGATLDTWMSRAHIVSDTLRSRLGSADDE